MTAPTQSPPAAPQRDPVPASHAATPPLTTEGWYATHQVLKIDRAPFRHCSMADRDRMRSEALRAFAATPGSEGWSAVAPLVGSMGDVMIMHFGPTLDAVGDAQRRLARAELFDHLHPVYTFLSVTEAGLYQLAGQLEKEAAARGVQPGDPVWEAEVEARVTAMREDPHVKKRLFPERPADMPYVCFYPMSKRRSLEQNWYELSLSERNRMMWLHGLSGRRYAGKVQQIVTGSIGFDAWEWGVTLFARDPLEFKRIVTEMRFDEVSARYGEFGPFYVGKVEDPAVWFDKVLKV